MLLHVGTLDSMFIDILDKTGLYGNRIEFLFMSCKKDIDIFTEKIEKIYYSKDTVSQEKILAMKTQDEFDILVKSL